MWVNKTWKPVFFIFLNIFFFLRNFQGSIYTKRKQFSTEGLRLGKHQKMIELLLEKKKKFVV